MKTTTSHRPRLGLILTIAGFWLGPLLALGLGLEWADAVPGVSAGTMWLMLGAAGLAAGLGTICLALRLQRRLEKSQDEKAGLEASLAQAGKMAALGKLAAGVAHEITNPLAIIAEQAGWIKDLVSDDQVRAGRPDLQEVLDSTLRIEHHVERVKGITQRMLGLARNTEPRAVSLDLAGLVRQTMQFLENQARLKNIQVELDLPPGLPWVESDPSLLQQVFLNLMDNALDAMDKNGRLTVAASHDPGQDEVAVSVSDTGCGIPPERLANIFETFYTTKKPGEGTGLGLAISSGIVKRLGGRISVQSAVGRGCTFTVTLPVKKSG